MSAHQETGHDGVTDADIAFLLARAADGVEIGTAPCEAVLRGGRRRRTRRWAVAAAAALVLAGSTGTLALAGGPGRDSRVDRVVTTPPSPERRHVYAPQRTLLASARDNGKDWSVTVDVWGAPRNRAEAARQWTAMGESGVRPADAKRASELVGASRYFVHLVVDDDATTVMWGEYDGSDSPSYKGLVYGAMPLHTGRHGAADTRNRLVIGDVTAATRRLTCTWDDGTTTQVPRATEGSGFAWAFKPLIREVKGSPADWFVCLAPEGRSYKSVRVTP
ncbi:hypothetical protein [Streptomyces sp. NPDC127038]|uniref:hypothetical protein n=1 Tax=Streptomyces sp. NPDC127038 TaxID=3347114 RepID=UPI00365BCD8E